MGRRDQSAHDLASITQDWAYPEKKNYGYSQRDEAKRAEFLAQLEDPKAPHLVYVDESGMDERDNYGYGYSPCGERFYDLKSGRRQGRINMLAGYRDGQLTLFCHCGRSQTLKPWFNNSFPDWATFLGFYQKLILQILT